MPNPRINRKLLAEDVNCEVSVVGGISKSTRLDKIVEIMYKGERKRQW